MSELHELHDLREKYLAAGVAAGKVLGQAQEARELHPLSDPWPLKHEWIRLCEEETAAREALTRWLKAYGLDDVLGVL